MDQKCGVSERIFACLESSPNPDYRRLGFCRLFSISVRNGSMVLAVEPRPLKTLSRSLLLLRKSLTVLGFLNFCTASTRCWRGEKPFCEIARPKYSISRTQNILKGIAVPSSNVVHAPLDLAIR